MTGIMIFESAHGRIAVEVDDSAAQAALPEGVPEDWVAKGSPGAPQTKGDGNVVVKATASFTDAMGSLKAYAASLNDVIASLAVKPQQVSVEIGLKLEGEAGFIIAKAGTAAEMKVALTWEPTPPAVG